MLLLENNKLQDGESDFSLLHCANLDYFTRTAQHAVFYFWINGMFSVC